MLGLQTFLQNSDHPSPTLTVCYIMGHALQTLQRIELSEGDIFWSSESFEYSTNLRTVPFSMSKISIASIDPPKKDGFLQQASGE